MCILTSTVYAGVDGSLSNYQSINVKNSTTAWSGFQPQKVVLRSKAQNATGQSPEYIPLFAIKDDRVSSNAISPAELNPFAFFFFFWNDVSGWLSGLFKNGRENKIDFPHKKVKIVKMAGYDMSIYIFSKSLSLNMDELWRYEACCHNIINHERSSIHIPSAHNQFGQKYTCL